MECLVGLVGIGYNIEYRMYNIYIYGERERERTKNITLKRTEKGVRLKREK